MNNYFWIDEYRNIRKTYNDLIDDINNKTSYKKVLYEKNPYCLFVCLLHSLVIGCPVELIDADFSEGEIRNIGIELEEIQEEFKVTQCNIRDFKELLSVINRSNDTWRLGLYTSGTTGRPKRVAHSLNSLTRNTKVLDRFKNDVWAFAYNATHIAGLQVFFQAFLNHNLMVYIFESDRTSLEKSLIQYDITHISATPTFYRTIIPYIGVTIGNVKRITFGGEKFDELLIADIYRIFPNSKIRNIYASTEAGSLLVADGDEFFIPVPLQGLIQITINNELLIHKSLLGASSECVFDGEWFNTGDIVNKVSDDRFRFVSRNTEMINVGGYKVNPHEVEDVLKKINGVMDVLVKARSNRVTGNILVADVVGEPSISAEQLKLLIYKDLSEKLQSWKIPRIINFVDKLEQTRTGKKVRK